MADSKSTGISFETHAVESHDRERSKVHRQIITLATRDTRPNQVAASLEVDQSIATMLPRIRWGHQRIN